MKFLLVNLIAANFLTSSETLMLRTLHKSSHIFRKVHSFIPSCQLANFHSRTRQHIEIREYTEPLFVTDIPDPEDPQLLVEKLTNDLTTNPDDPKKIYLKRGRAFLELQKYKDAEKDFEQVIQLDEKDPMGYLGRAMALSLQPAALNNAIADYNTVIEKLPKSGVGYLGRGVAYFLQRKFFKSSKDINSAFTKIVQESNRFRKKKIKDTDEMLLNIRAAPEEFPMVYRKVLGDAAMMKARLNYMLDRFETAVDEFTLAIQMCEDYSLYNFRGMALLGMKLSHTDLLAKQDFEKAKKLNPDFRENHETVSQRLEEITKLDDRAFLDLMNRSIDYLETEVFVIIVNKKLIRVGD